MGDVFLRALRMLIVPLVLVSIVSGIANIGAKETLGFDRERGERRAGRMQAAGVEQGL